MSKNTVFASVAEAAQKNAFVLPIFLAAVTILIASIPIMIEDYLTTYNGYIELPTRKVLDWVAIFVALVPQSGQAVMIAMTSALWNRYKGLAYMCMIGFFGCMLADFYPDIYYKIGDNPDAFWPAVFEALFIYTLMSEVFFSVGLGLSWELFPHAWAEYKSVRIKAQKELERRLGGTTTTTYTTHVQNQPRNQHQHNPQQHQQNQQNRNRSQQHPREQQQRDRGGRT